MCGINGIITADIALKKKVKVANRLIRHRGPDDEGYITIDRSSGKFILYSGEDSTPEIRSKFPFFNTSENSNIEIILAHRRLSIIDLSEAGHCPMSDAEGKVWIVYNGEIYNYIELRSELSNAGYKFRSGSDTEVIINSYLRWGTECLNRFNGMWAFAIWDDRKKILFMARDRFGVKPLYFSAEKDYFAFSSELKPLACYKDFKVSICRKKIPFYLIYGNRLNTNDTYLEGINSLPASHYLIYENGKLKTVKYYEVAIRDESQKSENELKDKIIYLLNDSIKLRFRSDVPVGTCLSGGFDSSSIVSLAASIGQNNIETFSAVWNEKSCDESYYIDIVNNRFTSTPNKVIPREDEFAEVFEKLCYHQEIPTEGPGLYPQWYVMLKAREKVKVLLDGQGGDEVFGGYFQLGAYLRGIIKDKKILKLTSETKNFLSFLNKNGIHSFTGWLFPKQYGWLTRSRLSEKFGIINKDLLKKTDKHKLIFDSEPPKIFKNYLNNLSYHFIRNITMPALLHYEDRSSMAHSIESRVPFLDYRLVELGVNLPTNYLSFKGISRPLYRKALKPFLPEEIVNRKDKLGFPVPFAGWTRGLLKNYVQDNFSDKKDEVFNYIDENQLKINLEKHFRAEKDFSWEIWRLLSLKNFLGLFKG